MPDELIRRNRDWAAGVYRQDPEYFHRLSQQQKPEYFWIGCADARVPANVVAGLAPGEVFVHRNVANIVHSGDLNLLSALEFAIAGLGIRKVIVCGHYGCGGVHAACDAAHGHVLVDNWIEPIRTLRMRHDEELKGLSEEAAHNRLVELNVIASVNRIAETPTLREAWERRWPVAVHGMVYSLRDGHLSRLENISRYE